MKEVPFTQYLLPDGRATPVVVDRPDEIADAAQELLDSGCRLECEVLRTGQVSFTVERDSDEGEPVILAHEVVSNGPPVLDAIDRLILRAAALIGKGVEA